MDNEYRDMPVQRAEIESLIARVDALESGKKDRTAFPISSIRIWHTLFGGLGSLIASVMAAGWIYDAVPLSGAKISEYLLAGVFGLVSIVTIGASIERWTNHGVDLGDRWRSS